MMLKVIHSNSNWHCNPNNSWRKWTTFYIHSLVSTSSHSTIEFLWSSRLMTTFSLSRMRWKKLFSTYLLCSTIRNIFLLSPKKKKRWWRWWCVSGVMAWVEKNKKTIKSNNACDTWKENICQWVWKIFPLVAAVEMNGNNSIQLV